MKSPERGGLMSNVGNKPSSLLILFSTASSPESCLPIWRAQVRRWGRWRGGDFLFVHPLVSVSSFSAVYKLTSLKCRCVEALTRAGEYDKQLLQRSVSMFEVWLDALPFCSPQLHVFFFRRISCCTWTMLVYVRRKFPMLERRKNKFSSSLTVILYLIGLPGWVMPFKDLRQFKHSLGWILTNYLLQPCYSDLCSLQSFEDARKGAIVAFGFGFFNIWLPRKRYL